jgi:hypothetical protein
VSWRKILTLLIKRDPTASQKKKYNNMWIGKDNLSSKPSQQTLYKL